MSQLSDEFPNIEQAIAHKHEKFIERFGKAISKVDGEKIIAISRIKARLELLARAFVNAKVIDGFSCEFVSSRDGMFPMSFCFTRQSSPSVLYLLNDGKDVTVSDSVGLAQSISSLESRIVLVTGTRHVCKRFIDILNENFDWMKMAEFVLDAAHEVLYNNEEVRRLVWKDSF